MIGLGVAVGKILEVSGGADSLAKAFVKAFGKGREPWAMGSTGALVSIPVFCDSGYVIMNPLARSIARVKQGGYVTLALALGCGMTLTHHLVPPTPGPLGVAGILGADLGGLILAGLRLLGAAAARRGGVRRSGWAPSSSPRSTTEVRNAVYETRPRSARGGAIAPAPGPSSASRAARPVRGASPERKNRSAPASPRCRCWSRCC